MQTFPKISIVTVNYNGAQFLERTIQSLLSQQYPNLEYVIIDGGSTDNSVEIIKKYESSIHYWVSEADRGMYDALQKGFEKTTGEIMGWLNSDDMHHPGSLFRIAEIFREFPQIRWLTGVPTSLDENDNVMIPKADDYPAWSKLRYYTGDYKWIQQESTVWTRSLWDQAGAHLDTGLQYAGDLALWLTFFKYDKLYYAPVLIGSFRLRREGQKSLENLRLYLNEAGKCLRKSRSPLYALLFPLTMADRILVSIPFLKKIYYKTGFRKILGYPPQMRFNRKTQKLEFA